MKKEKGLAPLIYDDSEILIIGTFPSGISICSKQYYANTSNNSFWKIIYSLYSNDGIVPNNYQKRKHILKNHRIALCDIYSSAERPGNLDSSINRKNVDYHDFDILLAKYPSVKLLIFNGKYAENEFKKKYPSIKTQLKVLPSTSNSARVKFDIKKDEWKKCLLPMR